MGGSYVFDLDSVLLRDMNVAIFRDMQGLDIQLYSTSCLCLMLIDHKCIVATQIYSYGASATYLL